MEYKCGDVVEHGACAVGTGPILIGAARRRWLHRIDKSAKGGRAVAGGPDDDDRRARVCGHHGPCLPFDQP